MYPPFLSAQALDSFSFLSRNPVLTPSLVFLHAYYLPSIPRSSSHGKYLPQNCRTAVFWQDFFS